MIEWNQSLSVGVEFIDNQHKEWFMKTNAFTNAVREGRANDVILETLQAMEEYTETHFVAEEKFMEDIKYPYRDSHVVLHDDFRENYVQLLLKLLREDRDTYVVAEGYLENWLLTHISKADKAYGNYFVKLSSGHGTDQG